MNQDKILDRITTNQEIFGKKPIIRRRRLAVEHVLGMLAADDTIETILEGYDWLEKEDIPTCIAYVQKKNIWRKPNFIETLAAIS